MHSYRIKYRYNPTGLIKVFTVEAESAEAAKAIIVSDWDGVVMECEQVTDAKQFLSEARNESGKYGNRLWVEVTGLHSIYILKISRNMHGTEEYDDNFINLHYCGYVGIPKSNPLYKKISDFGGNAYDADEDILDVYAHGGITFTGWMKEWGKDYFFVGFDCAHFTDACCVADLNKDTMVNGATFKSWDYAKVEVYGLYEQLSKVESELFVSNIMKKEDEYYARK